MEPAQSSSPDTNPLNRTRWWIHLVLIVSYILIVAVSSLVRSSSHKPALSHSATGLLIACGIQLVSFGVFFGSACWASRPSVDDLLLRWRGNIMPVLFGAAYSISLRIAVGVVSAVIGAFILLSGIMTQNELRDYVALNRPGVENVVDVAAMRNDPAYFWLTITVVSFVVAGVREELWRSAFLAGMKKLWPQYFGSTKGQVFAVCIAAVIFGSAHLSMGILAAFMAGLLGLGLGLIMVFHRSMWPAALAHGFFDATSMALIPYVIEAMKQLPTR